MHCCRAAAAAARARKEDQGSEKHEEIEISTDGTWMQRSFTSLFRVFAAICWSTGQLVDVTVLSKHCAQCSSWQHRAEKHAITAEEYTAWKQTHADSCNIKTKQSSPGMEAEGVLKMFQQSEEHRGPILAMVTAKDLQR